MLRLFSKFNTRISVSPKGSHAIILSLVGVLLFCLATTFFFIYHEKNYWPSLILSVAILIVIVLLWLSSRQDVDGSSIPSVNISTTDGTNSTTVSMHHRSIAEGDRLTAFLQVLSQVLNRSPLPEPDGLVDSDGKPVPQSIDEARQRIESANNQSEQILNTVFAEPTSLRNQEAIQQDSSLQAPKPSADNETASSEDES